VATSLSGIIILGILSAFVFLGRNLTRLVYYQQLEEASRRAFYLFSQDVSAAAKVASASDTSLTLTTSSGGSVTYTFSGSTLTRNPGSGAVTILSNLSAFDLNYYNKSGTSLTTSAQLVSIKEVQFTFTTSTTTGGSTTKEGVAYGGQSYGISGSALSGTAVSFSGVSPRFILRNTAYLQ